MEPSSQGMGQRIRYTVTVDDAVAANEYHQLRSPIGRRTRQRLILIGSIAMALLGLIVGNDQRAAAPNVYASWFPLVCGLLGGLLTYAFGSLMARFPHLLRLVTRRRFASEAARKYLGEHSLEVDDQGFTHRTAYSETRLAWGALDHIDTDQDRTYLYLNPTQFYIIPHNSIVEGDLPALLTAIKQNYTPGHLL